MTKGEKKKGASLNLLPMNRVCISEAGESNVPNTSRKARTISFDAPPPPLFFPQRTPAIRGLATVAVYLCISHQRPGKSIKKSVFDAQIVAFQTKTAAGPRGFFCRFSFLWACICICVLGYLRGFSSWLGRDGEEEEEEEEEEEVSLICTRGYGVIRILSVRLTMYFAICCRRHFRCERIVKVVLNLLVSIAWRVMLGHRGWGGGGSLRTAWSHSFFKARWGGLIGVRGGGERNGAGLRTKGGKT